MDFRRLCALLWAASLLTAGCASSASRTPVYDPALISGVLLFGEEVTPAPEVDMLGLSPEMEAFLDEGITGPAFDINRFARLMKKLKHAGFFKDRYQGDATYSASQTFALRKGNCMGYTNLFVALARGIGLDARFQLVENRPVWDVEGGYLVRNNHINVVIDKVSIPGRTDTTIEVDFNNVQQGLLRATSEIISDEFAESLFYANLAMDAFAEGDAHSAFSLLKRAIMIAPENKMLWNNLGVLYLSSEQPQLAERAYDQALAIDRRDKTALSGMVVALRSQQRLAEADVLAKRIKRYQAKRKRREAVNELVSYGVDT